jgi:hypothetical protein
MTMMRLRSAHFGVKNWVDVLSEIPTCGRDLQIAHAEAYTQTMQSIMHMNLPLFNANNAVDYSKCPQKMDSQRSLIIDTNNVICESAKTARTDNIEPESVN